MRTMVTKAAVTEGGFRVSGVQCCGVAAASLLVHYAAPCLLLRMLYVVW